MVDPAQTGELVVMVGVAGIGEDFKLYEHGELTGWLETTFENRPEGEAEGETMEVDS